MTPERALLEDIRRRLDAMIAEASPHNAAEIMAAVQAAAERAAQGSPAPAAVVRQARVAFAAHLLEQKQSRNVIRDRLTARFGVSRAGAYRLIEQALQRRAETVSKTVKF